MTLLSAVPTLVLGVVMVALTVLLAVAGLLLVRRAVPVSILAAHNDVAGFIYAVLGVLYAVLVPFVLVIVWEEFRDAQTDVAREAQILLAPQQEARHLPDPLAARLIDLERRYTQAVITDEWPRLAHGEQSPTVDTALENLAAGIRAVDPADPRQAVVYDHLLQQLDALGGQREAVAIDSRTAVPPLIWLVLLLGGLVVVGYTYLYGVERLRAQVAMTSALTIVIALALFVILALDYPFTGDLRVRPDDLVHILTALGPPS
jgi:ABC-type multidrug transport system fused ATPase/permease subunit